MEYPEVLKLYKYRAYNDNSLSMLINKKIWVSKPTAFNDPFDCSMVFNENFSAKDYSDYIQSAGLERGIKPKDIFNKISNAIQDGKLTQEAKGELNVRFKIMSKNIVKSGVYTLSQSKSEILLWAHYADSHRGFCIEYDRTPDNDLGNIEIANPVQYSDYFPIINLSDLANNVDSVSKALRTKYIKWKYEKEWRLFYEKGNAEEDLPAPITSIIFGLKMPDNHKRKLKDIMKGYKNVTFKKAEIVEGKYELDIVEH